MCLISHSSSRKLLLLLGDSRTVQIQNWNKYYLEKRSLLQFQEENEKDNIYASDMKV